MIVGILKESEGENRVAMLPEGVANLKKLNVEVLIETDAGLNARARKGDYENAGAKVVAREEVIKQGDILLSVNAIDSDSLAMLTEGKVYIAAMQAMTSPDLMKTLAGNGVTAFSLELVPRITRAQSMDILSSMATVAGYKAVMDAAHNLPYFFPMLMTAAGTIKPARVLVLGAGVAGLMAVATAKKLGAVVHAFDVRSEVKEQVESLGAKFVEVEGAKEDADAGGYAVEQTEDFKNRQMEAIHRAALNSDVIICTAQIPGRKAPVLLRKETIEAMAPASVVIDLAASTGGNCELTKNNQSVIFNQVKIIGNSYYPSDMPSDASKMFGNNIINFLKLIIDDEGNLNLNFDDEIVEGTCATHKGEYINERIKQMMNN